MLRCLDEFTRRQRSAVVVYSCWTNILGTTASRTNSGWRVYSGQPLKGTCGLWLELALSSLTDSIYKIYQNVLYGFIYNFSYSLHGILIGYIWYVLLEKWTYTTSAGSSIVIGYKIQLPAGVVLLPPEVVLWYPYILGGTAGPNCHRCKKPFHFFIIFLEWGF